MHTVYFEESRPKKNHSCPSPLPLLQSSSLTLPLTPQFGRLAPIHVPPFWHVLRVSTPHPSKKNKQKRNIQAFKVKQSISYKKALICRYGDTLITISFSLNVSNVNNMNPVHTTYVISLGVKSQHIS